jgi:predicted dehydrogenase
MDSVRWGIIGCGDVTEVKSGPALQKAAHSSVSAVMRRDGAKAEDYARRHRVERWYTDADSLIADQNVNAVYVATPTDSHADLVERALAAGKPVLVEKPMAASVADCDRMIAAARASDLPLVVAYYRRALPRFQRFASLACEGAIGRPRTAVVRHFKPVDAGRGQAWIDSTNGGIFADTQCHVIDWLCTVFGSVTSATGLAEANGNAKPGDDFVAYTARFGSLPVTGICAYSTSQAIDDMTIHGDAGSVSMSFFRHSPITLSSGGQTEVVDVADPPHVHQPFVERVVAHLLGRAPNPCTGQEGRAVSAVVTTLLCGDRGTTS